MAALRFCAYQYQNLPLDELTRRWSSAEQFGFDVVWNCDTMIEPDHPRHVMFDGPATLAMMATRTERIRIGTLVTSLYFRHPVSLAKAAMTVDHLSGGRVELALGVGDPSAGAAAVGIQLTPRERVDRFAEFVELTDLLLRQETTDYDGEYYRCDGAETIPRPVQQPRPPLTIAAHGPRMLRLAARYADGWSSWGGYGIETEDDFYKATRDRCRRFDDYCAGLDRDPSSIRHSVVCFPPLTPWESVEYLRDMVGRFRSIGVDEFVFYYPEAWRKQPTEWDVFEEVTGSVMPSMHAEDEGSDPIGP
jgi:alkanesulfonate monooxygenase SsuD/methylene tetrahydromethanopterin reductase-like flavin-dependent oxidoreductase (luciferase family)